MSKNFVFDKLSRLRADLWVDKVLAQYPNASETVNEYRSKRASTNNFENTWPDWCGVPTTAIHGILEAVAGKSPIHSKKQMDYQLNDVHRNIPEISLLSLLRLIHSPLFSKKACNFSCRPFPYNDQSPHAPQTAGLDIKEVAARLEHAERQLRLTYTSTLCPPQTRLRQIKWI